MDHPESITSVTLVELLALKRRFDLSWAGLENPGQNVLFFHNRLHFGVNEREASKGSLVHGVYQALVTLRETGLLTEELPVKIATVIGGFLQVEEERCQKIITKSLSRLVKGSYSTSFFSGVTWEVFNVT